MDVAKMGRWPAVSVVVAVLLSVQLVVSENVKYFNSMSFPHQADGVVATVSNLGESVQGKVRDGCSTFELDIIVIFAVTGAWV